MEMLQSSLQDNLVDEEVSKSIHKINKLFHHGIQKSSNLSLQAERFCSVSFQTSFEPFHVHEKAKEAEKIFLKILEELMEQRQLPQFLSDILQQQKRETALILEQYDLIISELSKSLTEHDKEYWRKCEKHSLQHQLLEENIENLISDLNRIGNEEIQNIRMSIIASTKAKTDMHWEKCQKILCETAADVPFDDYIWKPPTKILSFEEIVDAFLLPQDEVIAKRREMMSKICDLRKNLEKEKLDYTLKLEKLEKELFEIKENYKRKKLSFTNMKRKHFRLIAKRDKLLKELKEVLKDIEKECEAQKKVVVRHHGSRNLKHSLLQENNRKYECISKERYIDAYCLLCEILSATKFVMENILEVRGNFINLENLELCNKDTILCTYQKDFWHEFINAAPNDEFLHEVMAMLEDYWFHLKAYSELINKKKASYLGNQELKKFLRYYQEFKELHSADY